MQDECIIAHFRIEHIKQLCCTSSNVLSSKLYLYKTCKRYVITRYVTTAVLKKRENFLERRWRVSESFTDIWVIIISIYIIPTSADNSSLFNKVTIFVIGFTEAPIGEIEFHVIFFFSRNPYPFSTTCLRVIARCIHCPSTYVCLTRNFFKN